MFSAENAEVHNVVGVVVGNLRVATMLERMKVKLSGIVPDMEFRYKAVARETIKRIIFPTLVPAQSEDAPWTIN